MKSYATVLLAGILTASATLVAAQQTLACSYKATFPVGLANTEALIKAHFDSLGLSYNIRVSTNNQFANFVSFTINNGCDYQTQVVTIPQAISFETVQTVPGPGNPDPTLAVTSGAGDVVGPSVVPSSSSAETGSSFASASVTVTAKASGAESISFGGVIALALCITGLM
ncbi:UNVERIFIED_CONTAM: hypothetical protein HDU68_004266 [Siphonaria sp. JEL0065]|nr:hypothetical protein HDU68_004266 [Siphonaria sp. JEL0065]